MFSLTHLSTTELHWKQTHLLKMEYELHQQGVLMARLHIPSGFKSLANATCADGDWSFERVGILNQKIYVRQPGVETPIATLDYKTRRIERRDGTPFSAKFSLWRREYAFFDENGSQLVKITGKGVINPALDVEIAPAAALPPWLLLLGWFLVILTNNDTIAATAA
ncbi:MAG: hypothetical protein ACOYYS_14975 [Chloroflexota bacterium]